MEKRAELIYFESTEDRTEWLIKNNYTLIKKFKNKKYIPIQIIDMYKTYIGNYNNIRYYVKIKIFRNKYIFNLSNNESWSVNFKGFGKYTIEIVTFNAKDFIGENKEITFMKLLKD